MKHADALKVAESLVEHFRPACERIEIKGSLCRLKSDVKDIDLLIVPDLSPLPRPRAEFGMPLPIVHKTMLDKMIAEMQADGAIRLEKVGDHSKKFYLKYAGISVEMYLVLPPATWGVRSVIRTGPADFSHWMVTKKMHGGALPDTYYVKDGAVWDRTFEMKFETPEEIYYFKLCGLGWIEPSERVARWKR